MFDNLVSEERRYAFTYRISDQTVWYKFSIYLERVGILGYGLNDEALVQ